MSLARSRFLCVSRSHPRLIFQALIAKGAFEAMRAKFFETDEVPWAIFAHSMGTWASFEFILCCREAGVRPPTIFVARACAAPWKKKRDVLGWRGLRKRTRCKKTKKRPFLSKRRRVCVCVDF